MGITAYEDTFKSKNNYENILTGINKEDILTSDKTSCTLALILGKQSII